ncbi:MAG: hypothetical protein H6624_04560 [Bdellovibrionaceae bacterium]|nr:hypothetical protein [Pseudobdellovibrionaceae bacterium]
MIKVFGLVLVLLLSVSFAEARIPRNLRIVPGSELIINQTREAIEDLTAVHQISFQSAMLVYFVSKMEEVATPQSIGLVEEMVSALEAIAGQEVDESSDEVMAYSMEHQLYFAQAVASYLVEVIPVSAQKEEAFGNAVRKFVSGAKAVVSQSEK